MLKERLSSDIKTNGHNHNLEKSDLIVRITEWKAASLALGFSLFVLFSKTLLSNREAVRNFLWENKYVYLDAVLPDGSPIGYYINEINLKTSIFWLPLASGLAMTLFTWGMVYYDSREPGVYPPTPFSPNKSRTRRELNLDLGYVIALVNGVMVFIYMAANNFIN